MPVCIYKVRYINLPHSLPSYLFPALSPKKMHPYILSISCTCTFCFFFFFFLIFISISIISPPPPPPPPSSVSYQTSLDINFTLTPGALFSTEIAFFYIHRSHHNDCVSHSLRMRCELCLSIDTVSISSI